MAKRTSMIRRQKSEMKTKPNQVYVHIKVGFFSGDSDDDDGDDAAAAIVCRWTLTHTMLA